MGQVGILCVACQTYRGILGAGFPVKPPSMGSHRGHLVLCQGPDVDLHGDKSRP